MASTTQEIPQHLAALRKGTRKRQARAELRRRVFEGELELEEVLRECPEILRTNHPQRIHQLTVLDVICWPRGVQRPARERLLRRLGINPHAQLHSLSSARREQLVSALARSV